MRRRDVLFGTLGAGGGAAGTIAPGAQGSTHAPRSPAHADRLTGVPRIDVKERYGALFDGSGRPLSWRYDSLNAARAAFPNADIRAASESIDGAALRQAAFEAANGGGGILGLPDDCRVRLDRQISLLDAHRVWLWGGANSRIYTEDCGTSPALRLATPALSGDRSPMVPLRNVKMYAWNAGRVTPARDRAGRAWTSYRPGATALEFQTINHAEVQACHFNGYDEPVRWVQDVWSIAFVLSKFQGNNKGAVWHRTPSGFHGGERIVWDRCSLSNNNYGIWLEAVRSYAPFPPVRATFFVRDCSVDYNVVRQVHYIGGFRGPILNTLDINGGHFETSGAVSGALPRCYVNGIISIRGISVDELDANQPAAFCELGAQARAAALGNRLIVSSGTAIFVRGAPVGGPISGTGNILHDSGDVVLLAGAQGALMQAAGESEAVASAEILASLSMQGKIILLANATGTRITVAPDAIVNHAAHVRIEFQAISAGLMTLQPGPEVTLIGPAGKALSFGGRAGIGARVFLTKTGPNTWLASGDLNPR